jgi:hypothetical protein
MSGRSWVARTAGYAAGRFVALLVVILVALVLLMSSTSWVRAVVGPSRPVGSPSLSSSAGVANSGPVGPSTGAPNWLNVTLNGSTTSPPQGYGTTVTYDPADRLTLLFGGCLAAECPSNQTWEFTNGSWTNITNPTDAPPAREHASADFDANMGGVLLFGGETATSDLNDTWLFSGGHWTNLTYVGGAPSPRADASMAFDPQPEENGSVLYGGCVADLFILDCTNDTWVWEGWSGWVPLSPSATPPAVGYAAAAYDPSSGDLVLFGGCSGVFCEGVSGATWELYSGQWWPVAPPVSPAAREGSAMVYDPADSALLLFGGANASFDLIADTWTFSPSGWTPLPTAAAPSAREDFGLALDATGQTPLLVGGSSNTTAENDTWALEVAPGVAASPAATTVEASAPDNLTVTVSGGTAPYSLAVAFGDGTDALVTAPDLRTTIPHTFGLPGNYTAQVVLTDAVGATALGSSPVVRVDSDMGVFGAADPSTTDAGLSVAFSANDTPAGEPPITYAWGFGDNSTGAGATVDHVYAAAGTYHAVVTATDLIGATASTSVDVTVAADPTVIVDATPARLTTGTSAGLSAAVFGGIAPYRYSWLFGDGGSGSGASPLHQFNHTGTFAVQVWVNDSVGGSAHGTLSVTVVAASLASPSGAASPIPLWFWGGVTALALVAVVGSILLLRRRNVGPSSP